MPIRDIGIKSARDLQARAELLCALLLTRLISISALRKSCRMFDQAYRVLMTINKLVIYLVHN